MNKKNCFILTNTLKTGGAEKQCIYLYKALKDKYHTKLIVYYGEQVDERMSELLKNDNSQNIIYLHGNHLLKLYSLYKIFKKESPTICISYLATTNSINAVIGRLAKIPVRIGGIRSSKLTWFKKHVQQHLHNYWLSCTVFNNYKGFNDLTNAGFQKNKSVVIFNSIEIPQDQRLSLDKKTVEILSVGRFVEAKDFKTAFNAVYSLVSRNINLKYTVVGQGHFESELRSYVSQKGLDNYVTFIINPPKVDDYYRQADIYLSTSLFEGLSNSIMEAMSFNLPVVATDVGDNKYLVLNNETGFLMPTKNVSGISEKLELLINNSKLRKDVGENGYKHIKENFSVEKFTNEYTNLIERLMSEK